MAMPDTLVPMVSALPSRRTKPLGALLAATSPVVAHSSPWSVEVRRPKAVLHAVKPTIVAAASVEASTRNGAQGESLKLRVVLCCARLLFSDAYVVFQHQSLCTPLAHVCIFLS